MVGAIGLVVLVGFQLRSVVLAVPPVLPEVRNDLHLSFSAAGALSAIPVLGLGAAAIPGALLANRFGTRRVVGVGTLALGVAALLRITPPPPAAVYFWTAVMALAVAVVQPAIVAFLRHSFPGAVQQASTAYASSLGLGGLAGSSLSLHLLGLGGWRGTFVIWAALALAAGLVWLLLAPGRQDAHDPQPAGFGEVLRDRSAWHVATLFGAQSLVYYATATWIPFQLGPAGPGYVSLVLFLFNGVGLALGLFLVPLRWPWASSRLVYSSAGAAIFAGSLGFLSGRPELAPAAACLVALGIGVTFSGSTALSALFAQRPALVPAYASIVLTVGYAISFVGPLAGGLLVDRTHSFAAPFALTCAAGLLALGLGLTLPRRRLPDAGPRPTRAAGGGGRAG